jgi:hypothetical protein
MDPLFCRGNFDVHSWCAESRGNDPDSDFRRGIDLRRLIRTVVEHRLAQPRNTDSLRTTRRTNADSQELAFNCGNLCHCGCIRRRSGSERPLPVLTDRKERPAPISGIDEKRVGGGMPMLRHQP